jgi:hypothetical protein
LPYPLFDRSKLQLKSWTERKHDMMLVDVLPLDSPGESSDDPQLVQVAERVARAHRAGAPVILRRGVT